MKMNKKLRRILLTVCSAALLVCVTVGATVAYLTSTTETVTNTFTVGNVAITLDEVDTDVYGAKAQKVTNPEDGTVTKVPVKEGEDPTRGTGNVYKLIPGHEYTKDPTVHVTAGSEDCWLFVKVVNGISTIEAQPKTETDPNTTIAAQMAANGWAPVAEGSNVYAYKETVSAEDDVLVFSDFTIADNADVSTYSNASITIIAYAVQADGFASAAAAWNDAPKTGWN